MKEKCMKRGRKWLEIENIKEIFVRTHWDLNKLTVFRCVSKIAKNDYQLRNVCPSVCPHGYNLDPT